MSRLTVGLPSSQMRCDCGAEADSGNQRECRRCWRERVRTVHLSYAPSRSAGYGQVDRDRSRRNERKLARYAQARKEGIQPASTKSPDIEAAVRLSDEMGQAFSARSSEA